MRRLLVVAAVVGLVLAGGSAYAGQSANGSISVSPSIVSAGSPVHISGSVSPDGCPTSDSAIPVSTASLFPPDGFGPATDRDSQGAFDLTYTVPTSTAAGSYQIGLRCGGGLVGVTATLLVTAVPVGGAATGAGGTARGASQPWIPLGIGCLGLAGLLVALRRRLAARAD
jgi:hypothetical protein